MELRSELLKSIWYAFTALDLEKSGKVSKSQLKVLSHNLCTVLNIPHNPVALDEDFRDDDDGPVSNQGYMPYLNKFILDKVVEGSFLKENVDNLCWTLTAKKNYRTDSRSVLPRDDAFRLWCLFNFLSEDKYPLVMVPDEVEYLLKKICMAMNVELNCVELEDFLSQDSVQQKGFTVWAFLDMMNSGKLTRGIDRETVTMAVEQVYREIVGDVLKEGYLWKKSQLRRNWKERWFTLKPNSLSYFTNEDQKDHKGSIALDMNCCVEVLPDKDGKRCMLCLKTLSKTYEMSASDTKQRQEWSSAIQTAIRLERRRQAKEQELQRLQALQEEKARKLAELELLKEAQRQAQALLEQDELRRRQQHEQLRRTLEVQLQEAEEARASMQAEMALKEAEAEKQRKRIRELEDMQQQLEEALHQEIKARQDEEAFRYTQARLLAEEEEKMKALMALQEEQEEYILKTQREKQELKQEMESKSRALEEAQRQVEEVRANRHRVDQDVMVSLHVPHP
uniref:PH domain-containing protein n=1 Tax=Denticeps clupeoides TaxID=299321 RepID=A0AAY4D3I6_9TELE